MGYAIYKRPAPIDFGGFTAQDVIREEIEWRLEWVMPDALATMDGHGNAPKPRHPELAWELKQLQARARELERR